MFPFLFSRNQRQRQSQAIKSQQPKKINANRVVLFTNARDENNIKEWAAHHIILGFDNVIIFDHKSKEPLKKVFSDFDKRVTVIDGSKLEGQVKFHFMNWAQRIATVIKADWFLYLDADEFLVLKPPIKHVKEFLSSFPFQNASAISLNWLLFGSNFLDKDPNDLIVNSYTRSEKMLNPHVKTFVLTSAAEKATNPHFYNLADNHYQYSFNGLMKYPFCQNVVSKSFHEMPAYIAHYITQSKETYYRRKVNLPADDTGSKRDVKNIDSIHNSHNEIENYEVRDLFADNIKDFLNLQQGKMQD